MCEKIRKAYQQAQKIAQNTFSPELKIAPFGNDPDSSSVFACPWLEWWIRYRSSADLDGILMLQDWDRIPAGSPNDSFEVAIEHVNSAISQKLDDADPTTRRLLERTAWAKAIADGRWIVMNAVWGLPKRDGKSGYLGDKIHKAAFPIWRLIVESAAESVGKTFKLVTAGSWSRFDNDDPGKNQPVSDYLGKWYGWAKPRSASTPIHGKSCGTHYYVAHPSTWPPINGSNLSKGPP